MAGGRRPVVSGVLAFRGWLLVLSGGVLALGGCGFRLQGQVPLGGSLQVIDVRSIDGQSDFVRAIRRDLRGAGVRLEVGAPAVLAIEQDELLERVASVSARNVPREYELVYRVRFSFKVGSESRLQGEEVLVSRDFSFDERAVLAKEREREQLRMTLAEEAAVVVLQRLASLR